MPAAHCPICLNHFPLDAEKFAIFPCGHGFCTGCTHRLLSDPRPKCPNCRVIIHRRDMHPVFIQLVDSETVLQAAVLDGLDQMGPETPLVSIKKAGLKLGRVIQSAQGDGSTLAALLKAVDDFKERITPVFAKVESQRQELNSLREDFRKVRRDKESLQSKLRKTEPLQSEVHRLKKALSETEQNTEEALRLAEVAKDELASHHISANQWKKRAAELDQENKRFKDMLERHVSNARIQKEKNRKLGKQVVELTQKLAAEEKDSMSDVALEYDGDFSAHEHSRIHLESSVRVTPSRVHRFPIHDENKAELDLEGMPPRNFPSDWQLSAGVLKKRNLNGVLIGGHRRVGNSFPIDLDRKGHPTRAVQLGPKTILHVGR